MLGKKMKTEASNAQRNALNEGGLNAFLDRGTRFEGKLTFEGTVRIDGKLQGDIFSQDRLIIGEGGEIEGNVEVGECIISGTFRGELKVRDRVELLGTAKFYGTLIAPKLVVAEGVILEGNVRMEGVYREIENVMTPS
jgi:cytoskeletal protein CcmA (bactofilin family)